MSAPDGPHSDLPHGFTLPAATVHAPQAWARPLPPRSFSDALAWLLALAVLLFFAAFGWKAIRWSFAGGWHWLWLLVGVPVFPLFSAVALHMVWQRLRGTVRVGLEALAVQRDESLRLGIPLAVRLDAVTPRGARAPARIAMRLVQQTAAAAPDGGWTLQDQVRDSAIAERAPSSGRKAVHYQASLTAAPGTPRAAQEAWYLALHDADGPDDAPALWREPLAAPPL